jgi:hypothetical protein
MPDRARRMRQEDGGHNHLVPDLYPNAVIAALASDPKLAVFLRDDRIAAMPAKMSRRRDMLDVVAQAFEPGERFAEPVVDAFLRQLHDDHAALRRYLVDEEFLGRAGGEYWRIGGTTWRPRSPG